MRLLNKENADADLDTVLGVKGYKMGSVIWSYMNIVGVLN